MGAGKTTLMVATLNELKRLKQEQGERCRIVYVLNDGRAPGRRAVDSKRLHGLADLRTVADECFGCRDTEQLLSFVMARLVLQQADVIVIEGFGFMDGFEVPQLLKQRLNLETGVYTLVRASTFKLFRHAPTFPSQIRAANLGIGITNASVGKALVDRVTEVVGSLNHHVPVETIRHRSPVPARIFEWLQGDGSLPKEFRLVREASGGKHHHAHDHDYFVLNRSLREGIPPEEVMRLLGDEPHVGRIKFNLGSWHYNKTGNDPWEKPIRVKDDGENTLTIYSSQPVDIDRLQTILLPEESPTEVADTKKVMRGSGIQPDDLEALIRYGTEEIPAEPILADGCPVIFPESLVFLGECLHNPVAQKLDRSLIRHAINRRVTYFVACAENALPGSDAWSNPAFSLGKLYCAIAPAWFYVREYNQLDPNLRKKIEGLPTATFFGEGMLEYGEFSGKDESAKMFLVELENTLRYTGKPDIVERGLRHLEELARKDGRQFLIEGIASFLL